MDGKRPNTDVLLVAKRYTDTTPQKIQRLHDLIVLKAFEKTTRYDDEIAKLEAFINYLFYGIRQNK